MPMTEEEVFEKVQETLVEALSVDEEEVTPKAKIFADLGAESIDILDITFRLEKAFDIKIPRGELMAEDLMTKTEYVVDGKLTDEGLAEVKARLPHANLTDFEKDPEVSRLRDLFTVQTLMDYVTAKVNG